MAVLRLRLLRGHRAVALIFIALATGATEPSAAPIPGFVIAIFVSLFLTFNVFAIIAYFSTSRLIKAPNSSGVPPPKSTPLAAYFSRRLGEAMALFTASFSRATKGASALCWR